MILAMSYATIVIWFTHTKRQIAAIALIKGQLTYVGRLRTKLSVILVYEFNDRPYTRFA